MSVIVKKSRKGFFFKKNIFAQKPIANNILFLSFCVAKKQKTLSHRRAQSRGLNWCILKVFFVFDKDFVFFL
jgi:hypothetical protein